ncbi:GNAT family N-acetyltransferase [Aestuariivivens sediminicola]|uniref:GNAT family N-acetyltransferase n=1 Tax=Aestuariivivens sediminicola TaxID=2913560 RepID=UPI001F5A4EE9|nr:GNAT family N-acetyltransferase [Aestuariivivens sediminicola]
MIEKLRHGQIEIARQIYSVFQVSYAVEAELLGAIDFPPLKRSLESYLNSSNDFYGYFESSELAGVIEVERTDKHIDINSLVVKPKFFRRGIGRKLLEFTFNRFDAERFTVETGVENKPATALYKKLGFKEIKQWDTNFGIRKVLFEKRIGN